MRKDQFHSVSSCLSWFWGLPRAGYTGAYKQCAHATIQSNRLYKTANPTRVRRALASFSPLQYCSYMVE